MRARSTSSPSKTVHYSFPFQPSDLNEKKLLLQHYIPTENIIAIGDIHGQLEALKKLYNKLETKYGKELTEKYHILFLGDYVDRGADIKETIDWFIDLKEKRKTGTTHFLMGNHDLAFALFIGLWDDQNIAQSLGETCKGYLHPQELWNGEGKERIHLQGRRWGSVHVYSSRSTFTSYCNSTDEEILKDRKILQEAVPEKHKTFFKELPWFLWSNNYIFVHAGFDRRFKLKEQIIPLLNRDVTLPRIKPLSDRHNISMDGHDDTHKCIVTGHIRVNGVKISEKRILVDISV
ncbi:hypothetical protein ABK040_002395 [Willaertia magna]